MHLIFCKHWLNDYLFYSISILVYNKVSLYDEIWVKKAHLDAKSGSLQGWPFEIFLGETKVKRQIKGNVLI